MSADEETPGGEATAAGGGRQVCVPAEATYAPIIEEAVQHLRRIADAGEVELGHESGDVGKIHLIMPKAPRSLPPPKNAKLAPGLARVRPLLTPTDFAAKWAGNARTERAAAQEHFIDLCRMLGFETPNEADPAGDWYAFEKGADKTDGGDGFADVWKRSHFAWEYKRKRKNLDEAYKQLLQYREALENPPLLVVCDLNEFRVHTNFTNTLKQVHKFDLDKLATNPTEPLRILRAVMGEPEALRPDVALHELTEQAATKFAEIAKALRAQGHKPLRVAHFLNKLVFCMFAQHAGLLPKAIVQRLAEDRTPEEFAAGLGELFSKMSSKGGLFGPEQIQWFNGGLFDGDDVVPMTARQIGVVREVSELDWAQIEPAIFGTLFERGLDPNTRSHLGAHYTDRDSIERIIEPVLMAPLRREFTAMKSEVDSILSRTAYGEAAETRRWAKAHEPLKAFLDRLRSISVLDPACGSGNFLYVALQSLKNLERDAIQWGSRVLKSTALFPGVGPQVVRGIELNTYAAELARVSIWIGEIQWMRDNGFNYQRNPVLRPLKNIECADAVLDLSDPDAPREPTWPPAEFIVGNPPHLGGKFLRRELPDGDAYVTALFKVYEGRVAAESDIACYWFEKARHSIEGGVTKRAGLIGPQGIRGGANRKVLDRIKETGDIFLAWPDRDWVVDGAQTHVSFVGFDDGSDELKVRDGAAVVSINADLTTGIDVTKAPRLVENAGISFMGDTKGGAFEISPEVARAFLLETNPHGKSNGDVVKLWLNGASVTKQPRERWIIDFGVSMTEEDAALYGGPFEYVRKHVWPKRKKNPRAAYAERWWLHVEPRPRMRRAYAGLERFIGTVRHAKHRIFFWIPAGTVPDSALIVFARDDDYFFGVLQSHIHTVWSLAKGTQVREKETGFRYTPTTTFETFPFPAATEEQSETIATAAKFTMNTSLGITSMSCT